jgi:hypothetical protein
VGVGERVFFPYTNKKMWNAGVMGNFDLGQPDCGRAFPGSLVKRWLRPGAGHCAPASPVGLSEQRYQGCESHHLPPPRCRIFFGTSTPAGPARAGWPLLKSTCVLEALPCGPASETWCARARWAKEWVRVLMWRWRDGFPVTQMSALLLI